MRLRGAALAAVMLGSVLTGAAGAPASASAPASDSASDSDSAGAAQNPAITIKAIDRKGNAVPVTASLQSPTATGVDDTLTSAQLTRVPPGTYNIAAWVYEPDLTAMTLVDRELVIHGSMTVTFDARKGVPVRFIVNDPTATQETVFAEPYAPKGRQAFDGFTGLMVPPVYAVPGTMGPGYDLSLEADLVRHGVPPSQLEYVLLKQLKGTIPANLTFHVNKADLASDLVTVKAIDPGMPESITLQPIVDGNPLALPAIPEGQAGTPPFSVDFRLTPGYQWAAQTFSGTNDLDKLPVLGVHRYTQTFDTATFGPSPQYGPSVAGKRLQAPAPSHGPLFVDPTQDLLTSFGMLVRTDSQTWLYQGSKLLASSVGGAVSAQISASPHWYTLRVRARRGDPGPVMWRLEALSFNFQARANGSSPDTFWPRVIPAGLSLRNAARHGTKTSVRIFFSDLRGNLAAHGVDVWASANGGKTWQALRASQNDQGWTAVVTNPGTPGFMSLRVQGTDPAGDTATVTTINAYAIT